MPVRPGRDIAHYSLNLEVTVLMIFLMKTGAFRWWSVFFRTRCVKVSSPLDVWPVMVQEGSGMQWFWLVWYESLTSVRVMNWAQVTCLSAQFPSTWTCLERGGLEFGLFLVVLFGDFCNCSISRSRNSWVAFFLLGWCMGLLILLLLCLLHCSISLCLGYGLQQWDVERLGCFGGAQKATGKSKVKF